MQIEAEIAPLLDEIKNQSEQSLEVILVYMVSPSGKARNLGASVAKGEFLVFLDDDIRMGNDKVIANLIQVLNRDKNIGLAGASTLIPPQANRFQKRVGREIPRMVFPVVTQIMESDMVTTQCWAQRKENFSQVGPFSEVLERGVDPEYRYRVRSRGFKVVIAPNTWTFHPPAENFWDFCQQSFRNGRASARAQKRYPDLEKPVPDAGIPTNKNPSLIFRILKAIRDMLYAITRLNYLRAIERITYSLGYLYGKGEKL
jgi:GT2 family glycosyltransferase